MTGLYPWLGYQATERVTVWGVAGYGDRRAAADAATAAMALDIGAVDGDGGGGNAGRAGGRGRGGFELAFKADALWVGTSIDGVEGPAGRLNATAAAVTRFRTGLEGSQGLHAWAAGCR